jgi:hypothetical protein
LALWPAFESLGCEGVGLIDHLASKERSFGIPPLSTDGIASRSTTGEPFNRNRSMTTFDKREEAFENKFAHDEDLRFKATARRNKLLGLWVTEKLGLFGKEASSYVESIVLANIEAVSDDDIVRKVLGDFGAVHVNVSESLIRQTMHELLARATKEIQEGV